MRAATSSMEVRKSLLTIVVPRLRLFTLNVAFWFCYWYILDSGSWRMANLKAVCRS